MVVGTKSLGVMLVAATALLPSAAFSKNPHLGISSPMVQQISVAVSDRKNLKHRYYDLDHHVLSATRRGAKPQESSVAAWDGGVGEYNKARVAENPPLARVRQFIGNLQVPSRQEIAKDMMIAAVFGALADLFTQFACEGASLLSYSHRRTLAMTMFNMLYTGGVCHFVFATYLPFTVASMKLLNLLKARVTGRPVARRVGGKPSAFQEGALSSVAENFMHVPFLYVPAFFLLTEGPFKGGTVAFAMAELSQHWWATVTTCWCFWGPIMAANFAFVPPLLRVRFVAVSSFIWTIVLDYLAHAR